MTDDELDRLHRRVMNRDPECVQCTLARDCEYLIAEVRRLREENDEWHRISERWSRASGKQYGKLAAIRDLANARLADTVHMASIQEAECLWAIVNASEAK